MILSRSAHALFSCAIFVLAADVCMSPRRSQRSRPRRNEESEWAVCNLSFSSWPGIAVPRTASLPLAHVPAVHVFLALDAVKTWMPGTKPGHDELVVKPRF